MQIVEFALHATRGGLWRTVCYTAKELTDEAGSTLSVVVEVDVVGCGNAVNPKLGDAAIDP
jgi:hypothetical protein